MLGFVENSRKISSAQVEARLDWVADLTALDCAALHRGYEGEEGHEFVPRKKHRPMRLDMARH